MPPQKIPGICLIGLLFATAAVVRADVIQVDVKAVFNANVIVTCRDGKIVPAEQADHANFSFVSQSAAAMLQKDDPAGLPDDGHFAASERHPEVQLGYRNALAGNNARRSGQGNDKFDFAVPARKYTQMQLFVTAGNCGAPIKVTLTYADGSSEHRESEAPDWFVGVTQTDNDRFVLISGLDRVRPDGTEYEHLFGAMIYGINLTPDKNKALAHVTVEKSGELSTLCFFGATGQTAEPATQPNK